MNITELARRLKIPTQQLKDELPKLGFDIGRRAIKIDDAVAEKVVKLWSERQRKLQDSQYIVVEKKLGEAPLAGRSSREVELPPVLSPREFAALLGLPVTTIIGQLFKNGVMASINEHIDFETASIIAQDLGFTTKPAQAAAEVTEKAEAVTLAELLTEPDTTKLLARPPVVVVMGHVDHGKTTLLDTIRSTNVAAGESGAITQHIGAYQVTVPTGEVQSSRASEASRGIPRQARDDGAHTVRTITFLDTPGHEAFSAMRSRGGRLADIAIIVVAADDGLQPQTLEAIEIAQREELAFLFAINKVDKETADIERVKKALAELNLLPEDWGGKTICVPISAKKKQGIPELLDMVLLLADMEKLQANPDRPAVGTIIESHLDKGEGPVATALVQTGTLKTGDYVIAGAGVAGKLKAMKDFRGVPLTAAGPSTPVRILGLKQVPQAGDVFRVARDESEMREVLRKSVKFQRSVALPPTVSASSDESKESAAPKAELNLMLKADVLGSREAIVNSLSQLSQPDVSVKVVRTGLGSITENDVMQAEANHAIVLGFHVPVVPQAEVLAKTRGVYIKTYQVIYDLLDDVKRQLSALLKPELVRSQVGEVRVVQVFRRGKRDMIVGCQVSKGVVRGATKVQVVRQGEAIANLELTEVRIGREVVGEVAEGGECGLHLAGEPIVEIGDVLEVYHEEVHTRVIN